MNKTVAFCLFKYFPAGGLQRDFLRILQECQSRGYPVRVYTLSWEGAIPDGIDLCLVPVRAMQNHVRVKKFFEWVHKDLSSHAVAAVVGFNKIPGLDVYYAADTCFEEKARTLRSVFYRLGPRYHQYAAFERAVFDEGSGTEILMISKIQEPFFVKYYGTSKKRMHFLPPNVSRDRIAPPDSADIRAKFRRENGFSDSEWLIVQIGSGFSTKGVDRSIRALASLPKQIRNSTTLWLVGSDRSKRFEHLARVSAVSGNVVFTGGRDDIPQVLLGADLMIHPAYNENTGTVLLEAVAAGLPVLCTEVCGYGSYIKEAKGGLLIPEPFKQKVLNDQLVDLLGSNRLSGLGENAKKYAKITDLYSMHERAVDVIEETVKNKCCI